MTEFTRNWVLVYEEDEDVKYKEFDTTELAMQFVQLSEVKFVALMSRKYVQAMEEATEDIVNQTIMRTLQFFME